MAVNRRALVIGPNGLPSEVENVDPLLAGSFALFDVASGFEVKLGLGGTKTANRIQTVQDKNGQVALSEDEAPGHILGFAHRTTTSTVIVGAGEAYVESLGRAVRYAGGTISGAIPSNTTLHIYLLSNGTVMASSTAPAAPFWGTARSMTGFTSRRYLFSVRSVGTNLIIQKGDGGGGVCDVTFLHNTSSDSLLIGGGTSTTAADLSAATYAPAGPTTDLLVRAYNSAAVGSIRLYCYTGAAFVIFTNIPTTQELFTVSVPCDGTPKLQYDVVSSGVASVALLGYRFAR